MQRNAIPISIIFILAVIFSGCQLSTPSNTEASTHVAVTPVPATALAPSLTPAQALPPATATPPANPVPSPQPSTTPEAQAGEATALPDPQGYTWQEVVSGLNKPIGLANAGDGSGRLFVIEQRGRIRVVKDGALLPTPFLDIRERVGVTGTEQGLLGLVFHPHYAENGYFYVNYTDLNENTVIARFHVSANPNQADPGSEVILLHVNQPYPNHNGGGLAFGPDGYLYIALGDGGSGGDPHGNGQSLDTHLGKLLRIDVDNSDPYAIPADNPFAAGGGLPEIWAYGLRNPWRFSFDTLTGNLYIGDVGQDAWEEIDFLPAGSPGGANFGWNYREGNHPFEGRPPSSLVLVDPVAEYDHSNGCSVIGGVVYRGLNLPAWQGVYLYGDFCSGLVWGLLRNQDGTWQNSLLFDTPFSISCFTTDEAGEVYLADRTGGIYRLSEK